mgnify:CR=1 FL=1
MWKEWEEESGQLPGLFRRVRQGRAGTITNLHITDMMNEQYQQLLGRRIG